MTLSRIVSIFLLLVVGYIARKRKVLDADSIRSISNFVLSIALPFTIISSFDRSIPLTAAKDLLKVALYAIGIHLIAILVAKISFSHVADSKRKILTYITVFSNCGFMGFPVAESVFGRIGLMYASVYVMIFNIFVWTYGVALLSGDGGGKKGLFRVKDIIFNPGNVAVILGCVIWLLPFSLPETVNYAILLIGNCTTPLSMIVVGATLAGLSIKGLFSRTEVWIGSLMRLLIMPMIIFFIMRIFKENDASARVANFLVAMPAAAQTVIFAERYDADVSLASGIVFISTVFSAITIPLAAKIISA